MFDWITATVATLGYWGVASLTFLENLCPPIPSEIVIPAAGFVAATGGLGVAGVIAAGTLASRSRANVALVSDYVGVATNVVLAAFGAMIVRRSVQCWRRAGLADLRRGVSSTSPGGRSRR